MAIGAHPDDVELGVGGILCKHAMKGDHCVIIDLTLGELGTRGDVETRRQEAQEASEILGVAFRTNLEIPDGQVSSNQENKLKLINVIREQKPDILIAPAQRDRHPDHQNGYQLTKDCFFLSGLKKIKTAHPAWRPSIMMSYFQERWIEPDLLVDITGQYETKLKSIAAHKSQFYDPNGQKPDTLISSEEYWKGIEARFRTLGRRMGATYAEGLIVEDAVGINDLSDLYLPELS